MIDLVIQILRSYINCRKQILVTAFSRQAERKKLEEGKEQVKVRETNTTLVPIMFWISISCHVLGYTSDDKFHELDMFKERLKTREKDFSQIF